jgi:DNA-binding transcriptional regulator GbsR (MarR family)
MSNPITEKKYTFVDDFSLKMEQIGHPRIYGQILGWLLICDPPEQSFSDLMNNLNISKASVSNTTRMLLEAGFIKKVRLTGERQVYFRMQKGALIGFMERQLGIIHQLKEISEEGLSIIQDENADSSRLNEMNTFYTFLDSEIPTLIEKYKKDNS